MAQIVPLAVRTDASILIVDDAESNKRLLYDFLERCGYRLLTAELGAEATRIAVERLPDLILMDLKLPDMCGLEVTRGLKQDERTKSIPIIAVTARAMAGDEKKALQHGCDAYIAKPFRLFELLRTVQAFLPAVTAAPAPLRGNGVIR